MQSNLEPIEKNFHGSGLFQGGGCFHMFSPFPNLEPDLFAPSTGELS